jgi:1-deoxy-D-xylulose 5-phosphate reductoisomerase
VTGLGLRDGRRRLAVVMFGRARRMLRTASERLRQPDSTDLEGNDHRVEVNAQSKSDGILEQIVGRLSLEPTVSAASRRVEPLGESRSMVKAN